MNLAWDDQWWRESVREREMEMSVNCVTVESAIEGKLNASGQHRYEVKTFASVVSMLRVPYMNVPYTHNANRTQFSDDSRRTGARWTSLVLRDVNYTPSRQRRCSVLSVMWPLQTHIVLGCQLPILSHIKRKQNLSRCWSCHMDSVCARYGSWRPCQHHPIMIRDTKIRWIVWRYAFCRLPSHHRHWLSKVDRGLTPDLAPHHIYSDEAGDLNRTCWSANTSVNELTHINFNYILEMDLV